MSQTQRTVEELIRLSYLLIKEYDENEEISAEDNKLGLDLLNLLIDGFSGSGVYIPYNGEINFNLTAGKQEYTVSNIITADITNNRLVSIDYCNVVIDSIVFPVTIIEPTQIYSHSYVNNIQFRPTFILLKKEVSYSRLIFFPVPDQNYNTTVRCRFYLDKFEKDSVINNIPLSAQDFITFALGRRLRSFFGSAYWDDTAESEYLRLLNLYTSTNTIDLQVRPNSIISKPFWGYFGAYYPINVV